MPQEVKRWRSLDNAAKIFPCASSPHDTKVFRFVCELRDAVSPAMLQLALEDTLEEWSHFRCVLRKGLFWYYFEETDAPVLVHAENTPPCTTLYCDSGSQLFDVSYYRDRINFEVYHALTDGAGAMQFLKTLVHRYLLRRYREKLQGQEIPFDFAVSNAERVTDSFAKFSTGSRQKKLSVMKRMPAVYHLHGMKTAEHRLKVLEGIVPADRMLALAKSEGVTLTAMISAFLIAAIREEMRATEQEKAIVISIPVNLHAYFPTHTVQNFFSVANIGYTFVPGETTDWVKIARSVGESLQQKLSGDYLQDRLDAQTSLERWMVARVVPLFFKRIILRYFYHRSEREYTSTISNLGAVQLPEPLEPFVRRFQVFNSTRDLQICLCTYQNEMSISFTSQLLSNEIIRRFFNRLTEQEIPVLLRTNRFPGMGVNE